MGAFNKLSWYVKRLRKMGMRELTHRVGEQLSLARLKKTGQAFAAKTYSLSDYQFYQSDQAQLFELPLSGPPYLIDKDHVTHGQWPALGYSWQWQSNQDNWHTAPDTQQRWPQVFFTKLNYREGNPYGDTRVVWEIGRLQQLTAIALLIEQEETNRTHLLHLFQAQWQDWLTHNPPYIGVHYVSAMECALRLIAVCHAFDRIRFYSKATELWQGLPGFVESHASLIQNRLSLHSSAGNHTIAEAVGLMYAGQLFPEMKQAPNWFKTGLRLLEQEGVRQILNDGCGIEQAPWYQLFITDLIGLAIRLVTQAGRSVSGQLQAAYKRSQAFLAQISSWSETIPKMGDADDGFALLPNLSLSWSPNLKQLPKLNLIALNGYTLMRNGATQLLVDHAPLGMAPSFGHGHADALSIQVRHEGYPFAIDCGTGWYTGNPRYRNYLRGTAAHNTVSVNHKDQAHQESAFMWSKPFEVQLLARGATAKGSCGVVARHNGYASEGVVHTRGLLLDSNGNLIVIDQLDGSISVQASLHWHFVEQPEAAKGYWKIQGTSGAQVTMQISGVDETQLFKGSEQPMAGWYSPVYGELLPCYNLVASIKCQLPHTIYTVFRFNENCKFNEQIKSIDRLVELIT